MPSARAVFLLLAILTAVVAPTASAQSQIAAGIAGATTEDAGGACSGGVEYRMEVESVPMPAPRAW